MIIELSKLPYRYNIHIPTSAQLFFVWYLVAVYANNIRNVSRNSILFNKILLRKKKVVTESASFYERTI